MYAVDWSGLAYGVHQRRAVMYTAMSLVLQ
jgi:hypothetical protein